MGEIILRNWDIREFPVQVNLPSMIQQVHVPIRRVITPVKALPNRMRKVVPLISHIRSYPPHCYHIHPPSLSLTSPTLTSLQNRKLSYPSLSLHVKITSGPRVQHMPTRAYTKYSIHQVKHTVSIASTAYCIIPRSAVSCSQPVSHLSADHVVHNSLHSHNHESTDE
jgi:hypothetical protein